jgi:hypothetical protein
VTRQLTVLALALLTAFTAGCGPEAPTFTVGNVTVRDEIGLVEAATAVALPEAWDGTPAAIATDGLTSVIVAWAGGSCVESWTLTVSGFAIVIDIQPGDLPSDCYGVLITPAVRLDLNRAVDASNIVVNLAEEAAAF